MLPYMPSHPVHQQQPACSHGHVEEFTLRIMRKCRASPHELLHLFSPATLCLLQILTTSHRGNHVGQHQTSRHFHVVWVPFIDGLQSSHCRQTSNARNILIVVIEQYLDSRVIFRLFNTAERHRSFLHSLFFDCCDDVVLFSNGQVKTPAEVA